MKLGNYSYTMYTQLIILFVSLFTLSEGEQMLKLTIEERAFLTSNTSVSRTNLSSEFRSLLKKDGTSVSIHKDLYEKIVRERSIWHSSPWLPPRTATVDGLVVELECLAGNAVDSFPDSIFQDDQLLRGGFLLYLLFAVYAFVLIAYICNDYFLPSVEIICEDLNIPQNVAAATFMAVATSFPEFFTNLISTFLTESDMGIGTIIGSALFNLLGVAAIGGLAAIKVIPIESRAVTRDVLVYCVNLSVLVVIVWDSRVEWFEAVVLAVLYVLYFLLMFNSIRLFHLWDLLKNTCSKSNADSIDSEKTISQEVICETNGKPSIIVTEAEQEKIHETEESPKVRPLEVLVRYPLSSGVVAQIWWLLTWPIKLCLCVTVPSVEWCRRLYPLTFLMCIVWIGACAYCVSWCMTVIGYTLLIPDSVMGMTFLAFGGCVPEACSIFIMSRRGEGGIGVSNALGANSLAILFALGVPWLIKTVSLEVAGAEQTAVLINSAGIDFVLATLLVATALLWFTLCIGDFTLKRPVGLTLAVLYVIFITVTVLVELGIIFNRGIEIC